MNTIRNRNIATAILSFSAPVLMIAPAFAGQVIPAPLVGALGPVGILAAGAAYGGYRVVKYMRSR